MAYQLISFVMWLEPSLHPSLNLKALHLPERNRKKRGKFGPFVPNMQMGGAIYGLVSILLVIVSGPFMASAKVSPDVSIATLLIVDRSGNGDFRTIQDAIDAVPSNNKELVFIRVRPGAYREKVTIPANKPFITLSGGKSINTIITSNQGGDIYSSATFTVLASDFVARHLTFQNTHGPSGKAVALRVAGDRAAFYGCRIISYQDTLLDDAGNHYYSKCYIEGAIDFIFGNAASLFERCHLHSTSTQQGSITAQRRVSPIEKTGFTFVGCHITGKGTTFLGRPWGAYSRVIFAMTYMSSCVVPQGWDNWGDTSKQSTAYYAEYKCYGPGALESNRVHWLHTMSDDEAAPYLTRQMIGGTSWLRPLPTRFRRPSDFRISMN